MSNTYKADLEKTAIGIVTSTADHNSYDVRDGSTTSTGDYRITAAADEEVDGCYYGVHVDGGMECLTASDKADGVSIELEAGSYTRTELLCKLAQKVYEDELHGKIMELLNDTVSVYAIVLGGGTCVDMELHKGDNDGPARTIYWRTYRNQEVECPKCGDGRLPPMEDGLAKALRERCPCCMGSGYVPGEAFTIMRWRMPRCIAEEFTDTGESFSDYDNTYGQIQEKLGDPIEVADYDPEHDVTGDWRWKHGIVTERPVTFMSDEWAALDAEERAEYELIDAARKAGVL